MEDLRRYPGLTPGGLARLREALRGLRAGAGRAVPLGQLVRLAGGPGLGAGVTVDFAGASELGAPLVVLRLAPGGPDEALVAPLSPREREVAGLLAGGLSNKQIARRLGIRLATVKDHVHRVLRKTRLPSRAAVAAAYRGGAAGDEPTL
jgi:DNA-binding CsgD family transcriptional regulator